MVTPDWTAPQASKNSKEPNVSFEPAETHAGNSLLARPLDRLAAVIVDNFVILAPLYILFSSPLKKWMTVSYLTGSEAEFLVNVFGMVLAGVSLIVLYQTFMHYFFRATVGKYLFDVRVVSMFPGQQPTLWDCFIRSWIWCFEIVCFMLPLLSVFSNGQRRPWHDRLCDTVVVSHSRAGVAAPARWEQALVRSFFTFFLAIMGLSVLAQIQGTIDKVKADAMLAALVDRDAGACEVVSKNLTDEDSEKEHGRLELAMTLYAAGLAERTCLESEVEREVSMQVPVAPITYLAQAFIHADDADISNSYLDQVCEESPSSVECSMSQVVSQWSEEDWEAVEESLTKAPRGSGYLEVWGVRHFMKQAHYSKALALLNGLIPQRYLSEFSMVQRVKGFFNSYREPEAEAALLQAVSTLPETDSKELSAWVCAQQLQHGCAAMDGVACQQVGMKKEENAEIDFEESNEALARVLALECHNDGQIDYLSFADAVRSEDWQTFFRANLKHQKGDKDASAHLFSQLIFSPEAPDILKIESARRWAQFANRTQIEELYEQWRVLDSKETWVKTGNFLFRRMTEAGHHDLALKVARYLMNTESLSPQALAVLTDMMDAKVNADRKPANVKVRDQVKQLLDSVEVGN
jgi:uncharacterized RDD family membrane protein YckC